MTEYQRGQWDMFERLTSHWYGKQYYFLESNGTVYSRVSNRYMSVNYAYLEFIEAMCDDCSV